MKFRRIILNFLICFALVIVQVSFFNRLSFQMVTFDGVFLWVAVYGISFSSVDGAIAGFLCGVFLDAAIGRFVGPEILMLVIIGYIADPLYSNLKRRSPFPVFVMIFLLGIMYGILKLGFEITVYGVIPQINVIMGMVGTALLASLFTPLVKKIARFVGPIMRQRDVLGEENRRGMVRR